MKGLPASWTSALLSEIAPEVKTSSIQPLPGVTYELWSVPSFADRAPEVIDGGAIGSSKRPVAPDDVLVCKINPRINRVWKVGALRAHEQIASPEWIAVRPKATRRVDPDYLRLYLSGPAFRSWISGEVSGVTGSHTRAKPGQVMAQEIPLPPHGEQRRIVDLLEDHLSRLDAAVESLRTSLHRTDAMVVSSLAAQVTAGSEHWLASTVGQQAELIQYGSGAKCGARDTELDVPVLRMGNVKDGALVWGSLKYLPSDHEDFPKLLLEPGDLLFNRTNSAEHVGKSAVFDLDCAASFASYLIRVRFGPEVLPQWVSMVINSPMGRQYVASVVSQQVGQANVNGTKLKAFPLPLPSREEQDRRVSRHAEIVESRERLRGAVDAAAARADGLRRSLLAAAFSGRLTGSAPISRWLRR